MSAMREGDCIEQMQGMEAASIDAVVCDPPYSLRLMGASWDSHRSQHAFQEWCREWATEALRVLKPGGHLLAFGGTRTYHRLASGIEDAGFEIRDSLLWLYGSGFGKSWNFASSLEAIDRREVAWRPLSGLRGIHGTCWGPLIRRGLVEYNAEAHLWVLTEAGRAALGEGERDGGA
ncbi:MAG: DNA methyltransferase [Thermoleophilaceae bacterium]